MARDTILVVDDEPGILAALRGPLEREGYRVVTAASGEEALGCMGEEEFDALILDVSLPEMDGLDLLEKMHEDPSDSPPPAVIMLSAHGTVERAVRATRLGAYDFLEKPASLERVFLSLRNALIQRELSRENRELTRRVYRGEEMVGNSSAMEKLRVEIARAAPSDARVLITGESGVGKELVARAVHRGSPRNERPLVAINCAAMPEELIESELFGHEKGAFTGAYRRTRGQFEGADGGTLFLDEVAEMSPRLQAKLLRVLQEGEFQRVGGGEVVKVDVRVISATRRTLEEEVKAERFREDLFYRLNVIPIHIPPLRERSEDIPHLTLHLLRELARNHGSVETEIDERALAVLCAYAWPGNVRELENVLERLIIMGGGDPVGEEQVRAALPSDAGPTTHSADAGPLTLKEALEGYEKEFIARTLAAEDGNVARAARRLGLERSHLYKKLRHHKLR